MLSEVDESASKGLSKNKHVFLFLTSDSSLFFSFFIFFLFYNSEFVFHLSLKPLFLIMLGKATFMPGTGIKECF